MWYEIIPCVAVLGTLITIPHIGFYVANKLGNNRHAYLRDWCESDHHFSMFSRDLRMYGSDYRPRGLESLPEPNSEQKPSAV